MKIHATKTEVKILVFNLKVQKRKPGKLDNSSPKHHAPLLLLIFTKRHFLHVRAIRRSIIWLLFVYKFFFKNVKNAVS